MDTFNVLKISILIITFKLINHKTLIKIIGDHNFTYIFCNQR